MGERMRIRAKRVAGVVDVKILMSHPMETGLRQDADGNVVPANYIEDVVATCNGRTVLAAQWGASVSKNPYLAFRFRNAAKGDQLVVTWTDTAGDSRTDEVVIA